MDKALKMPSLRQGQHQPQQADDTAAQQRRHPCGEPSAPGRSPVGAGVALGDADRLLHHLLG